MFRSWFEGKIRHYTYARPSSTHRVEEKRPWTNVHRTVHNKEGDCVSPRRQTLDLLRKISMSAANYE